MRSYYLTDNWGQPVTDVPAHWGLDRLTHGGNVFCSRSHREAREILRGYLRVDGPRGLAARTDDGALIVASLYHGMSYIRDASGRTIARY